MFLGGSWANDSAHSNSDLDVVIVDDTANEVSFEGVAFDEFVVEACVLSSSAIRNFVYGSAKYRSAPVPPQIAHGILILGNEKVAANLRSVAADALAKGPDPISQDEKNELRWELSVLLVDLAHASPDSLIAIAAVAHNALSKAILDINGCWRADRKALRKAVLQADPELALALDSALAEACSGDPTRMLALCEQVLDLLGGSQLTYPKFSP